MMYFKTTQLGNISVRQVVNNGCFTTNMAK